MQQCQRLLLILKRPYVEALEGNSTRLPARQDHGLLLSLVPVCVAYQSFTRTISQQ